jgi:hypothetical protein
MVVSLPLPITSPTPPSYHGGTKRGRKAAGELIAPDQHGRTYAVDRPRDVVPLLGDGLVWLSTIW